MFIINKKELSLSVQRRIALEAAEAGIAEVLPLAVMKESVSFSRCDRILCVQNQEFFIPPQGRIFVVGAGKASGLMAQQLEKIIGAKNIAAGVVNCNYTRYNTQAIKIHHATHPLPSAAGVAGAKQILSLKGQYNIGADDLVIALISGGGSALLPCPAEGISLRDKQKVTQLLLACGAEIKEINIVRKHLSKVKGGQLGRHFAPARVVSIIISDVIGNHLGTIASGPTTPDRSTFSQALGVLKKYRLLNKVPPVVRRYLEAGQAKRKAETPKRLNNCFNFIVGDNGRALDGIAEYLRQQKFKPLIITDKQKGSPEKVAKKLWRQVKNKRYAFYNAFILGGETTPVLPPRPGQGGRNQHFIAQLLWQGRNQSNWTALSIGTDGSDYLSGIGGAIVDSQSWEASQAKGLDLPAFLARFDSYNFFKKLGHSLIKMRHTGTNVGDVVIYLAGKQ